MSFSLIQVSSPPHSFNEWYFPSFEFPPTDRISNASQLAVFDVVPVTQNLDIVTRARFGMSRRAIINYHPILYIDFDSYVCRVWHLLGSVGVFCRKKDWKIFFITLVACHSSISYWCIHGGGSNSSLPRTEKHRIKKKKKNSLASNFLEFERWWWKLYLLMEISQKKISLTSHRGISCLRTAS